MTRLLLLWILNALALLIVAHFVRGFYLQSFTSALIAVVVIGFLNATLGLILKIVTLPISILTLGIFFLVINALILRLAGNFVPGFYVAGFGPAFWGAAVLALLHMLFRALEGKN